jgi:hypothetical protein
LSLLAGVSQLAYITISRAGNRLYSLTVRTTQLRQSSFCIHRLFFETFIRPIFILSLFDLPAKPLMTTLAPLLRPGDRVITLFMICRGHPVTAQAVTAAAGRPGTHSRGPAVGPGTCQGLTDDITYSAVLEEACIWLDFLPCWLSEQTRSCEAHEGHS